MWGEGQSKALSTQRRAKGVLGRCPHPLAQTLPLGAGPSRSWGGGGSLYSADEVGSAGIFAEGRFGHVSSFWLWHEWVRGLEGRGRSWSKGDVRTGDLGRPRANSCGAQKRVQTGPSTNIPAASSGPWGCDNSWNQKWQNMSFVSWCLP